MSLGPSQFLILRPSARRLDGAGPRRLGVARRSVPPARLRAVSLLLLAGVAAAAAARSHSLEEPLGALQHLGPLLCLPGKFETVGTRSL